MSNNLAQLEALIEDLRLNQDIKIKKLIIEGDSQIILNVLGKRETPNWILISKLEYALYIVDNLKETIIKHIYREGNKEENNLANKGANRKEILVR